MPHFSHSILVFAAAADNPAEPGKPPIPPIGELESSNDCVQWQRVCTVPGRGYRQDGWILQTTAFPQVTARFFRLNLHGWDGAEKGKSLPLGNVRLNSEALIDQWEEKSANVEDFSDPTAPRLIRVTRSSTLIKSWT